MITSLLYAFATYPPYSCFTTVAKTISGIIFFARNCKVRNGQEIN